MRLPRLRALAARRLSESQKIVLKKLRHGEHRWQRAMANTVARRVSYNLADASAGHHDAMVNHGYDAWRAMSDVRNCAHNILTEAGIEFVELPRVSHYRPILVIRQADVPRVLRALEVLPADDGWQLRAFGAGNGRLRAPHILDNPASLRRLTLRQQVTATSGREMSTYQEMLTIEPWEELDFGVDRVDGSTHLEGTVHRLLSSPRTFVDYIVPDRWRSAVDQDDRKLHFDVPHLYQVDGPIDFVYTWVDGDDPDWQKRWRETLAGIDPNAINKTAASESRFKSRDELLYSLRSVEYYASWVNHIYIVSDSQIPAWLNTEHPKISVIDHREIFRRSDALPVFNSHAIESQLHHIPGLSERYLYMNDDIMFMRPVEPDLFFTGNGMSKFYPSKAPLDISERSARDMPVMSAAKRGRDFIQERFNRTVTNKFKHTPHPQLKTVLQQLEQEEQEMFDEVSASKLRHPDDYSIPSALYHFYAYAAGRAVIGSIGYAYMDIAREDARLYLDRLQRRRDLDVLCLNDTHVPDERREDASELLSVFFEERFPVPSTFERAVRGH